MSAGGPVDDSLRLQLEGGLELLEASLQDLDRLRALLGRPGWRRALRGDPALPQRLLEQTGPAAAAEARLLRRADEASPRAAAAARALVAQLGEARKRLRRQALRRLRVETNGQAGLTSDWHLRALLALAREAPPLPLQAEEAVLLQGRWLWGGAYWLTATRLVLHPRGEDPCQVLLPALGEDSVRLGALSATVEVRAQRRFVLRGVEHAAELAAQLELRRRPPLAGGGRRAGGICLGGQAAGGGGHREGVLLIAPGAAIFLPLGAGARALQLLRADPAPPALPVPAGALLSVLSELPDPHLVSRCELAISGAGGHLLLPGQARLIDAPPGAFCVDDGQVRLTAQGSPAVAGRLQWLVRAWRA